MNIQVIPCFVKAYLYVYPFLTILGTERNPVRDGFQSHFSKNWTNCYFMLDKAQHKAGRENGKNYSLGKFKY